MSWKSVLAVTVSAVALSGALAVPAGAAVTTAAAPAAATQSCYVFNEAGSALNVRSGPGTGYAVVGSMAAGSRLPCGPLQDSMTTGGSYSSCGGGNTWLQVTLGGRTDYVAERCVSVGMA
ncbi:SH3 domain-containing protein [Kitasatospora sp. NPDC058965]|uniref:SH3 domain-containing protein n=1 Tax=Kitasatospora sp. NPDC058965 TaxID=3346682 RepID=UPI00368A6CEF